MTQMPKDSQLQLNKEIAKELHTNGSGYDVLRYICLPDLLGKDAPTVLYIMGKNLARKFQPANMEETMEYFHLFGWGDLRLEKEKRREVIFKLTGSPVEQRFKKMAEADYRLEAGFLAESLEQMNKMACECFTEMKSKNNSVQFNAVYTK